MCPVGADYERLLADALDAIPERDQGKDERLDALRAAEAEGADVPGYTRQARWIGTRQGREPG